MRLRYSILPALVSALILGSAGTSLATTFSYVATIDGAQEVPPNASGATGSAFLVYDDVANTLTTSITFSGLYPLSASHIHGPAAVGVGAGVLHGFPSAPAGATFGSYNDVWVGLTAAQVGYLNSSLLYINIHSQFYPGGEIRGQIVPEVVTPTRALSWGKIKALYR